MYATAPGPAPRTPAELRELALQLAVDLARNGRLPLSAIPDETTTSYADAVIASATQFAAFLQGPDPAPIPADPFGTLTYEDGLQARARALSLGHHFGDIDAEERFACTRCFSWLYLRGVWTTESQMRCRAYAMTTVTNLSGPRADPELISSGRTLPTGHLIGSVGAGNIADCDYCGASVIDNGRITLAGARACPVPGKSDDSRAESVQEYVAFLKTTPDSESARAHAWGDADPETGVVRCTVCLGRRWGRPFAPGDNAVGERPCPGVLTCPACRHAAHADVCFNPASDNDCACTFDSRTIGFASAAPVTIHSSHDVRNAATSVQWCNTCGATIFALGVATESGAAPCEGGYSDDMDGSPS